MFRFEVGSANIPEITTPHGPNKYECYNKRLDEKTRQTQETGK